MEVTILEQKEIGRGTGLTLTFRILGNRGMMVEYGGGGKLKKNFSAPVF